MTEQERERLRKLLTEEAIVHEPFILSSGKLAYYYVDGRLITMSPEGSYLVAKAIIDKLNALGIEVDAVGGPTIGADPMAGAIPAVSFQLGQPLRGFIVRKEAKAHGTGRQVEGPVAPGMTVAIVDDAVTTGTSLIQAAEAVEAYGCTVACVIGIIDRLEVGRANIEAKGYRFESIFTIRDLGVDPTA